MASIAGSFDSIYRQWQVPAWEAAESYKLGWINESCQEGTSWHESQRGFSDWKKSLEIFAGTFRENEALKYRSNFSSNRLKTNIRVTISGLAAIRPWSGYDSNLFKKEALMMNLTTRSLYLANFWDQSIKEVLYWSGATGTGFARPVYRRNMAGQGQGKICIDTYGMPSVLPVQMPASGDYQRAYVVTLMDEKPIWEAHGLFPDYQDRLRPTTSQYWYSSSIRQAATSNADRRGFFGFLRRGRANQAGSNNLVPVRYSLINDLAINTSGRTVIMGEQGSSWSYEVPNYGSEIPSSSSPDATSRKADVNDCRLYPYRRLIISSENCVMYDGPAFNWHGELDLIPLSLERYPWEPMGFGMIHDGYGYQKSMDNIDRGNLDKINADMDRPLAYNMNAVGKREANQVDLMQPRQRIAFDGDAVDKPFTQIAPDDVYKVSPESLAFRQILSEGLDYTLQNRDVVELSKARALGKGVDQLEALISASGPLVKDMSRTMEQFVCGMAEQVKYLVLQYMDTSQLIPFTTEAGVRSVFDYDPSTLVPSHMPGEPVHDELGQKLGSPSTRIQRARWFARNLPFTITPHSIHEIHQIQYVLMQMQQKQRGAPIPWSDIMESAGLQDVKRATGSTVQERYWSEKYEELEWNVKAAAVAQGLGLDPAALMGGAAPEGRPPSGQAPPQLETKGDGRTTISESG